MISEHVTDFSQDGEQEWILRSVPEVGRFLDIGAWHATKFSNVRALFLQGWSGVLVEPHPDHAARLRRAYERHPSVVVMECAVALRAGRRLLHATDDAVSTMDLVTREKWREAAVYDREVLVECSTLEQVYDAAGPFDFVSIDAEGFSVDLAVRLFELPVRLPVCVCVEYDDRMGEVLDAAARARYRQVFSNGTNVVLQAQ